MRYTDKIFAEIIRDRQLRLKVALALNLSENGVMASAKRKSSALTKFPAPDVIRKELKLTDSEMFEPLMPAHV